jgi:dihydrofolate reductase
VSKLVKIIAIAAMDEGRVIGAQGRIPWHLPEDMQRFAAFTTGHTVIMGRKTFDSLPANFKPLPKRKNIVLTRHPETLSGVDNVEVWTSSAAFIDACRNNKVALPSDKLWIIGGAEIYLQTMPLWDEVMLTLVHGRHEGDVYFPEFEQDFLLMSKVEKDNCAFLNYVRRLHERTPD